MKPKKTIYYEDPLNDDFVGRSFKYKPLSKKFRFYHWDPIYWIIQETLYYVIAVPILWLVAKIFYGYRIVGKRKLKKAKIGRKGYFIYGNHTSKADAFIPALGVASPRHPRIVCADNAMAYKVLNPLLMMLGALPLPSYPEQREPFFEAIKKHYQRGNPIIIFPEAHIWPYCSRIRPFGDASFSYPAQLGAPVFAICTTFEERKIFKFIHPKMVVHISDPIYPDMRLPLSERTHALRQAVYDYMEDTSASLDNVEYYRYLPKEKKE